jgi:hypothetical protein
MNKKGLVPASGIMSLWNYAWQSILLAST